MVIEMTPIDVMFWITVALLIIAIAFLVLGIGFDDPETGVTLAMVFFGMAFITFVLYALLWVIYQAVT
jgi:hypothetical protein